MEKIRIFNDREKQYSKKRGLLFRLIPILVGAVAVVFAYWVSGLLREIECWKSGYEEENILSANELVLSKTLVPDAVRWNNTQFSYSGTLFDKGEIDEVKKVAGVKVVTPFLCFSSEYSPYADNQTNTFVWRDAKHLPQTYTWTNQYLSDSPASTINGVYQAVSYLNQEKMDSLCLAVNETIRDGAYLTAGMARKMGIDTELIDDLVVRFDICVPLAYQVYEYDTGEFEDLLGDVSYSTEYGAQVSITVPVRGILRDGLSCFVDLNNNQLALPYRMMNEVLEKNRYGGRLGNERVPWEPKEYVITLENSEAAGPAAEKLLQMSPSYILGKEVIRDGGMVFWFDVLAFAVILCMALVFGLFAFLCSRFEMKRSAGMYPAEWKRRLKRVSREMTRDFLLLLLTVFVLANAAFLIREADQVMGWVGYVQNIGELYRHYFNFDVNFTALLWSVIGYTAAAFGTVLLYGRKTKRTNL